MYLIVDRDYRIFQTDVFSGRIRTLLKAGEVSVVNTRTMKGMNIDGLTMEVIPTWEKEKSLEDQNPLEARIVRPINKKAPN